jgi:hypothetical protein
MKSWKRVALTVTGLAGVLMACSSSSTTTPSGSGTGSGQGSSKGSGASSSSGGGGGGGSGCYAVEGTGSSETCTFTSSTVAGFTCTSPEKSGTCPSGFVGCCGETIDGTSSFQCYYGSTEAMTVKASCASPDSWVTTLP